MKYLILSLLIGFPSILFSQVSDIEWQHDINRDVINITYTLNKESIYNFYDIKVTATEDGKVIQIKSLLGDVGEMVKAEKKRKKIEWNVLDDVDELLGVLAINISAIPNPIGSDKKEVVVTLPKKNKNLVNYVGLGGSIIAGGAMIALGTKKVSDGNDMYDIYEKNRYENADIYGAKSRAEYYDEANSDFKSGNIIIAAGGVIVVAGAFYFINKIIKTNKKNSQTSISIEPANLQIKTYDQNNYLKSSGAVVTLNYKF